MREHTMTTAFPHRRRAAFTALAAIGCLTLAGCAGSSASDGGGSEASTDAASAADFPRTVAVGDRDIDIDAEPQHVAALSTEVGDIVLELVGPERLVAVAEGSATPGTGNQLDLAESVPTHLSVTQNPDPEQILSLDPDLVLLTGRHDDEASLIDSLEGVGVPIAAFESTDFGDPETVASSIETIGDLVGADSEARTIASAVRDDAAAVTDAVADVDNKPRVLVLMARGGTQMIMGAHSSTTNLVELAGGSSVAVEEGWNQAMPADPEAIIAADPDVIVVQDFRDAGLEPFAELLENPALADVRAVADDEVHLVDAETTSGTAGSRISEGLKEIAELLHPDVFA